jgi:hypothetical protein
MRWIIVPAILCPLLSAYAQEASVEIGGLEISRGMLKEDIRSDFPRFHCGEYCVDTSIERCSVGDGVPPEADGQILFENGRVHRATRYWHVPKESGPYETLVMLNNILKQMTEESSTCAEIAPTFGMTDSPGVTSTAFWFPEKVLYIQTQKPADPWPAHFFIHETLRPSPVPTSYEVRQNMDGTKQCVLVE